MQEVPSTNITQSQPTQQTPSEAQLNYTSNVNATESNVNKTPVQDQQLSVSEDLGFEIEETNYSAVALYDYQACMFNYFS